MKFIITGSGGCGYTPKPLCQCPVCVQAREKGRPYARCGCSLYLEDISLLVDTPEDIPIAINNADIRSVDSIIYSHADPDHTLGMRVVEHLRLEWLKYYDGIKIDNPIAVCASAWVMRDLNGIRTKYGPLLDYYESMGMITRRIVEKSMAIGGIDIAFIPVPKRKAVSVFVFESGGKKLIYAPCDCVPFPDDEILYGSDVLVMGNTFIGDALKNGKVITAENPIRKELFSFEGALEIKKRLNAKRLILTHIEEEWGKSYDDYLALEKEYDNVCFAYDGMEIDI
jgi:phosphoribosyl 1,2-cyclic phosphate phosphodiesterase